MPALKPGASMTDRRGVGNFLLLGILPLAATDETLQVWNGASWPVRSICREANAKERFIQGNPARRIPGLAFDGVRSLSSFAHLRANLSFDDGIGRPKPAVPGFE